MRVRVTFRYRADTGEVEVFEVDDLQSGPRLADHDARHDRAAADVARVVETNAMIEELSPGTQPPAAIEVPPAAPRDAEAADRGPRDERRERSAGG
jgi:FtsH ternary system domain X3